MVLSAALSGQTTLKNSSIAVQDMLDNTVPFEFNPIFRYDTTAMILYVFDDGSWTMLADGSSGGLQDLNSVLAQGTDANEQAISNVLLVDFADLGGDTKVWYGQENSGTGDFNITTNEAGDNLYIFPRDNVFDNDDDVVRKRNLDAVGLGTVLSNSEDAELNGIFNLAYLQLYDINADTENWSIAESGGDLNFTYTSIPPKNFTIPSDGVSDSANDLVVFSSLLDNDATNELQTASEVSVVIQNGIEQADVQLELEAIRADISAGGDGWGADVVNSDNTLTGNGTVASILKVDTSLIATKSDLDGIGGGKFIDGTDTDDAVYTQGNIGIGLSDPTAKIEVESSGVSSNFIAKYRNTAVDQFLPMISMLAPNAAIGNTVYMTIGHSSANYNRATWGFKYVGSGDSENYQTFGFFGAEDLLNILGNGDIGVGTITPTHKLSIGGADAAIRLNPHDNEPTGVEGALYANDSEDRPKYHNGTDFKALAYNEDVTQLQTDLSALEASWNHPIATNSFTPTTKSFAYNLAATNSLSLPDDGLAAINDGDIKSICNTNTTTGVITMNPPAGHTVGGLSSIDVLAGECYTIQLDATANDWRIVSTNVQQKKSGGVTISDLTTSTTPISVIGGAGYTQLTNDAAGAQTDENFYPTGVSDQWDEVTGNFDWSELTAGDQINIRITGELTTSSPNTEIEIILRNGIGGTSYDITFLNETNYKNAGTHHVSEFSGFVALDSNTIDNGSMFMISSDTNCDFEVTGWYIQTTRR